MLFSCFVHERTIRARAHFCRRAGFVNHDREEATAWVGDEKSDLGKTWFCELLDFGDFLFTRLSCGPLRDYFLFWVGILIKPKRETPLPLIWFSLFHVQYCSVHFGSFCWHLQKSVFGFVSGKLPRIFSWSPISWARKCLLSCGNGQKIFPNVATVIPWRVHMQGVNWIKQRSARGTTFVTHASKPNDQGNRSSFRDALLLRGKHQGQAGH